MSRFFETPTPTERQAPGQSRYKAIHAHRRNANSAQCNSSYTDKKERPPPREVDGSYRDRTTTAAREVHSTRRVIALLRRALRESGSCRGAFERARMETAFKSAVLFMYGGTTQAGPTIRGEQGTPYVERGRRFAPRRACHVSPRRSVPSAGAWTFDHVVAPAPGHLCLTKCTL